MPQNYAGIMYNEIISNTPLLPGN